jgi:hypothetical protein
MKYRLTINGITHLLCAQALYKHHVKGHWQTLNNVPYQNKSIVVELNLTSSDKASLNRPPIITYAVFVQ